LPLNKFKCYGLVVGLSSHGYFGLFCVKLANQNYQSLLIILYSWKKWVFYVILLIILLIFDKQILNKKEQSDHYINKNTDESVWFWKLKEDVMKVIVCGVKIEDYLSPFVVEVAWCGHCWSPSGWRLKMESLSPCAYFWNNWQITIVMVTVIVALSEQS